MSSCRKIRKSLVAYRSGDLSATEVTRVEQHLDGCPACEGEVREIHGLDKLLREGFPAEMPSASFESSLSTRLLAERQAQVSVTGRTSRLLDRLLMPALVPAATAAILVALVVGTWTASVSEDTASHSPLRAAPVADAGDVTKPETVESTVVTSRDGTLIADPAIDSDPAVPAPLRENPGPFVDYEFIRDLEEQKVAESLEGSSG